MSASNARPRILCYVVTYNAALFIGDVLARIPKECWQNPHYDFHVVVSDDSSTDNTLEVAAKYASQSPHANAITVRRTARNLGYGGNQKLGYDYACAEKFDAVVLLHGDAQYDPEYIPALLAPLLENKADVVLGSRMMHREAALKGGMPRYKFFANIFLTRLQNRLTGAALTEFHTGFRAYAVPTLASIAYARNDDGFSFDTEILLQLMDSQKRITEIAIPTHYGKEVCHVNGLLYAWQITVASICFRLHQLGFIYDARLSHKPIVYPDKTTFASSHQFALCQCKDSKTIADLGGGAGYVARALRAKGCEVIGFDHAASAEADCYNRFIETDIATLTSLSAHGVQPDAVLLLDVLEHLAMPEQLLMALHSELKPGTQLIVTVPNIAFITIRLKLLLGSFTYASRGILDRTHLRFYTFTTLAELLRESGYDILSTQGIPAPFPLVIPNQKLAGLLLKLNRALVFLHRGLFSFQIAMKAVPRR